MAQAEVLGSTAVRSSNAEPSLFVECKLCGADDYEVLFPAGVAQIAQIVKCRRCGLMYANPRGRPPDHEDVETWDPSQNLVEKDPGKIDKQRLCVRDYEMTREYLASLYPQRGSLLEIGSGLGFLLRYFKNDGWDVLGVEPFTEGCQFAREENGVDAIPAILETANLPDASRDVVLMMHVIEHVPDPMSTFKQIYRVLKPGGHAVLETPRYDGWMFKILGRRERSLACDGHIYFFTQDTLRGMSERAGFRVKKLDLVGRSMTLERLLWNVNLVSKNMVDPDLLFRVGRKLRFEDIRLHLNVRDMQRIVVQKPL